MELNRRGFLSGLLGTAVIAAFPPDLVCGITAVPEVKAPEGVTYEWARTALLGEPDLENIERRIANGWTFVTQEAHPGIEFTGFAEVVERNGLALMQKPTIDVERAREELARKVEEAMHSPQSKKMMNILNSATNERASDPGDGVALYSRAHTEEDWKRLEEGLPKLIKALNAKAQKT